MIKKVYWYSCKDPLFLSHFNEKLEFSRQIFERYLKFMKIGCTERTKRRAVKLKEVHGLSSEFCKSA